MAFKSESASTYKGLIYDEETNAMKCKYCDVIQAWGNHNW